MRIDKDKKSYIWFWIGVAAVSFMLLPFLILGENAVVVYHDQLDGELLAYLFAAMQPGAEYYEQFMGGMNATALTVPAPLCTLLFAGGHCFAAYVAMQLLGSLVGYLGIWLLGRECNCAPFPTMVVGVLFAYLPFLPVYGLSQYGIPLLIWSFSKLYQRRYKAIAMSYALIYAACSSLVLVGFAVLGLGAVGFIGSWLYHKAGKKELCRQGLLWTGSAWLGMLLIYIVENAKLLGQMLGWYPAGSSHKAEYVLSAESFPDAFWQNLWQGGQHSEALQQYILVAAGVTLVAFAGRSHTGKEQEDNIARHLKRLVCLLLINVLLAFASALWNGSPGILLRSQMSALRGFQLDRVLWVAPAFWYLILLTVLELWWVKLRETKWSAKAIPLYLGSAVTLVCVLLNSLAVVKESCIKPNLQKLINPSYQALSYQDYYAADVMQQVKEYLEVQTGQEPWEYRVVSLGIDPAAAYYTGFYCLDGYSNNYSLEYKHAFREVIAPELAKSEYLTQYYDAWGNRCYLVSAECPGYYTIEKGGFYFQQLELNTEALAELGGDYVLSAAYIQNAEAQGLTLMREDPFETQSSYYRIFLYEVTP